MENKIDHDKIARIALKLFIKEINRSGFDVSLIEEREESFESSMEYMLASSRALIEKFNAGLLKKMCRELSSYIAASRHSLKRVKRVLLRKVDPCDFSAPAGAHSIPPFSLIAFSGLAENGLPYVAIRITYKIEFDN